MKSDGVTRSYTALSAEEQVNLIWHYSSQGDEMELARVMGAIPKVALQGPPLEYIQRTHTFMRLLAWWGIQHWQAQSRRSAAMAGLLVAEGAQQGHFRACLQESETYLLALDEALKRSAEHHGFDADVIWRMAGAECFQPMLEFSTEAKLVEEIHNAIERIIRANVSI